MLFIKGRGNMKKLIIVCICLFCFANLAWGAILTTGNVWPSNPGSWDSSTWGYIGLNSAGTMSITGGSDVLDYVGFIGGANPGSTGEVTVDGAGSTWTNTGNLQVGHEGSGMLRVTHEGAVTSYGSNIGVSTGSIGEVAVDGAGSTWTNDGHLSVGSHGNGTLNITNGGAVINGNGNIGYYSGSTGEVTVDGADSTWTNNKPYNKLCVGLEGNGTLNITNGGKVSNEEGHIGSESGSTGDVTVDGAGSTWTNSDSLSVGRYGNGRLNITNSSVVSNRQGYIGEWSGSTGKVTVEGASSTWTNKTDLYIGRAGNGTLNISSGGTVSSDDGYIGRYSSSTSEVTVDGAGSRWTNNNLFVGYSGSGTLNITNGGKVSYNSIAYGFDHVGYDPGSTGEVTVDGVGSSLRSMELYVGNSGNGTLNITGSGLVDVRGGVRIGDNSGSTGEVRVNGAGSMLDISTDLMVGLAGNGTLNITSGGRLDNNLDGIIGSGSSSTGVITVDGAGSKWTIGKVSIEELYIGRSGNGTLNITAGGEVSSRTHTNIGYYSGSVGVVTVDSAGSTWTNHGTLHVGRHGDGTLEITNNGLVSVAGTLTIDHDGDDDSFINMATGGMLALFGEADESLVEFLGLVEGTDAIRLWSDNLLGWTDITNGINGLHYSLNYITEGDLNGYTMLTAMEAIPEPGTMILFGLGGILLRRKANPKSEARNPKQIQNHNI